MGTATRLIMTTKIYLCLLVCTFLALQAADAFKCKQTSRYDNDCDVKIESKGIGMCYRKKNYRDCCKMCDTWRADLKKYENLPKGCEYGDRNQYACRDKTAEDCKNPKVKKMCCKTCK